MSWAPQVLTTLAIERAGVWASRSDASYRTREARKLDVRLLDCDAGIGESNIPSLLSPTIASWSPIWAQQAASFRTAERPTAHPGRWQFETLGWLAAPLALIDQAQLFTWPGGRPLTIYRKTYPRLNYEQTSWITPLAIASVPSWDGIFQSQANSFVPPARPLLDPRTIQFDQSASFIQSALDPQVGASASQYGPPIFAQSLSFRTPDRPVLNPCWLQFKERKFGIPFDPALLQGALTQSAMAASYRTPDVNRLMGPYSTWNPDAGIFQFPLTLPVQQRSAVMAQLASSYQTPARALLDVRTSPSHPTTGWELYNLDPLLRVWAPANAQLANTYRTKERHTLDPRGIYYDEFGWLDSALTLIDPPKKKLSDHRLTIMGAGR